MLQIEKINKAKFLSLVRLKCRRQAKNKQIVILKATDVHHLSYNEVKNP